MAIKKTLTGHCLSYTCPNCGDALRSPLPEVGTEQTCPQCGVVHFVPGKQEADEFLAAEQVRQGQRADERQAAWRERKAKVKRGLAEAKAGWQRRKQARAVERDLRAQDEQERTRLASEDAARQPVVIEKTVVIEQPTEQRTSYVLPLFVLVVIVAYLAVGNPPRHGNTKRPKSPSSSSRSSSPSGISGVSGIKRINGDDWFGCTDKAQHEKLTQYAVQKDIEAYSQAIMAGLNAGTCRRFRDGEEVYIADITFLGLVKVRPKGEMQEYWTNIEAVTR
jgi:predicted  nucleic acid-binding Zn-ribbon protein